MSVFTRLKGKTVGDIISKIEFILSSPRIRLFKTIYINFRCLPFKQAIKLPIIVKGNFSIHRLGNIRIDSMNIHKGMVYFGAFNNKSAKPTKIVNSGTIIFRGYCTVWEGVLLEVGPNAVLDIGNEALIGENVNIMIRKCCKIGEYTRITFDSQIMDSDFHYMLDMEKKEIKDCTIPVILGDYIWIGNRTTIKKGTILPDYAIVASNSLLSKDYRATGGG